MQQPTAARLRTLFEDDRLQQYQEWMSRFLAQRGLERPDGRMLFSYRASREEYLSLRTLIAGHLRILAGDQWQFSHRAECACFVLYAAEWWRREYAGGAWRWTSILASFGEPFNVDVFERTVAVERGLHSWGHRPGGHGKKYLGAIVAQGGLPLQLVGSGDGAISRLLMRAMRQAQMYAWDPLRLEGFFAAHADELVQHVRDEAIYVLLASIVVSVLGLRHEHRLAGVSNPVALLNRVEPRWRERFPIAVDDQAAEQLLTGLVREAAKEVKAVTSFPVMVTRTLQEAGEPSTYAIATNIEMPSSLSAQALAQATGLAVDRIPQFFSVDLLGQARLSLGVGRQLTRSQEANVLLSGPPQVLKGKDALREQVLVLRSAGADLHEPVEIPGASELDESQPWTFAARDGALSLVGVGSCRLPEAECLVCVGDDFELVPCDEESTASLHGIANGLTNDRLIYQAKGTVEARGPDGRFLIRTGQSAHLDTPLVWRGTRLHVGSRSIPLYRGLPQLYRIDAEGQIAPVPTASVEWSVSGKAGERIAQPRHHTGPVDAWVLQDGRRHRRFRMVLLAPGAKLRFASGASESEAAIEFIGWGLAEADAATGFTRSVERENGTTRVSLAVRGAPPEVVPFALEWANSPTSIRLDLPFPVSGGKFCSSDGGVLGNGQTVSVRDLQKTRVQVFDRNPESPRRYMLSVELKSPHASRSAASASAHRLERLIPVDHSGFGELRLLEIESAILGLLCHDDQLDTRLELVLHAGPAAVGKLLVKRYEAELQRDGLELELPSAVLQGREVSEFAEVQLRALPLLVPEVREAELAQGTSEGIPTGRWRLGALAAEKGPWLVYPARDSSLQVRPMLHEGVSVGPAARDSSQLCELGRAMAVVHPAERMNAIEDVVAEMAQDLEHRSWELITRQYQLLGHLPLPAFDYWRALAKHTTASVAVLLKLADDLTTLSKRMRDELGVTWELVPRSSLSGCLASLERSLGRQLKLDSGEAAVRMIAEQVLRSLAQAEPSMEGVIGLTLFQAGYSRTHSVDLLIGDMSVGAQAMLHKLWTGEDSMLQTLLLRAHSQDALWPSFGLAPKLVEALQGCAAEAAQTLAQACGVHLLWRPTAGQSGPYAKNLKEDAANVPLLVGILSQLPGCPQTWRVREVLAQIRQIRSFDPSWFEVAHRVGLLLALMVEQNQLSPRRSPAPIPYKASEALPAPQPGRSAAQRVPNPTGRAG